jgi:hypothetical protein
MKSSVSHSAVGFVTVNVCGAAAGTANVLTGSGVALELPLAAALLHFS